MKLSAQEEYGLRCLLALARAGADSVLTIPSLAESEGLSRPHVAKVMRGLRRSGFVRASRGHSGGYTLASPPSEVNLGEVLSALGGRMFDSGFCTKHAAAPRRAGAARGPCAHTSDCSVRSVWKLVQTAVDSVLGRLRLSDLIVEEKGFMSSNDLSERSTASARRQLRVVEISR
jgi:Rrf2 family protein